MAKLPDIRLTRGDWGTPAYVELNIPCRVLKDGLFRGAFPDAHAANMAQFYETSASELTDKTLDGLTSKLNKFADWLAESTKTTKVVIFYKTKFNGQFSLSANKLVDPEFTTRDEWQKGDMSFETSAAVAVGATLRRITISTGRDGQKTYTLSPLASGELGEFGAKLLEYGAGPEIRVRHMTPKDMPPFVEYNEELAEMFVHDIEATYYRAIELRDKLSHLTPINDTL